MPQSNRRVSEVDIRSDMRHYYRGSIATYLKPLANGSVERLACYIHEYHGDSSELRVEIQTITATAARWSEHQIVPNEAISYELPHLGSIKVADRFVHLTRSPQRRMRKGYNEENVHWFTLEGDNGDFSCGVMEDYVIKQVWYGCTERLSTNVVLWGKGIYYKTEKVATVDDTGSVIFIPNKEKLGEFVCKLLANNWEEIKSKHSNLTLPS